MADETITTPVTTADVDTSSSIEPTDTTTDDVNVSDDTSIQGEEPTSNDGTAVTEEQEPTLYAGKYKSVDLFLYENCTVHNIINLFLIDI